LQTDEIIRAHIASIDCRRSAGKHTGYTCCVEELTETLNHTGWIPQRGASLYEGVATEHTHQCLHYRCVHSADVTLTSAYRWNGYVWLNIDMRGWF